MNKAKMAKNLREWINIGNGVDSLIYDSPFQTKDYSPYVVDLLIKKTPLKQIPYLVLEQLENELIQECEPKKSFIKRWIK